MSNGQKNYPMQLRDIGSCSKCGVKKGTACRQPGCEQLKLVTYETVLPPPKIFSAPGIPADLSIDDVPMFLTHTVRELHDGWFIGYPLHKVSHPHQSSHLKKIVIGNRFTGDMFFTELRPITKFEMEAALKKAMVIDPRSPIKA